MVAAKKKVTRNQKKVEPEAEAAAEAEVLAVDETPEENNGESAEVEEQASQESSGVEESAAESSEAAEPVKEEKPAEEKKEEKVETGKLLVENLPSSLLFEYQDKLKDIFSKYGEIISVKRGPIIVTELTTTPTLAAIVEFKNKDSLVKAVEEDGHTLDGLKISVTVQPSTIDTTILVGVPFEASIEYVRLLFAECGEIAQVQEFSKTKYKIFRVTYQQKDSVQNALRLDRELRINGFFVTVTKYREDDEQKAQVTGGNANKRHHQARNNAPQAPANNATPAPAARTNNYRGGRGGTSYVARGGATGYRGRGGRGGVGGYGAGRGAGAFTRGGGGGYAGGAPRGGGYMGRGRGSGYMGRGGFMNDGQRPNKRLRQE